MLNALSILRTIRHCKPRFTVCGTRRSCNEPERHPVPIYSEGRVRSGGSAAVVRRVSRTFPGPTSANLPLHRQSFRVNTPSAQKKHYQKGSVSFFSHKARPTGLEPATSGSTVQCSNQLSYGPKPKLASEHEHLLREFNTLGPVHFGRRINVLLRWDYIPTPKLCKSTRALLLSQRNFLRLQQSSSAGYSGFSAKNRFFCR
jgi:hypothetical protein